MIQTKKKTDCCGCSACVQACPKQCISFDEDEQGFRYPVVNQESCIDCGLCEKVCPCLNSSEQVPPKEVYAVKNPDEKIRKESSSGGVFTMLAENVLDKGGIVFGARFNEKWEVVHDYTETKEGLIAFRGSKYVQSQIRNTYIQTKEFLNEGRIVLFSGTPCQIAGLKKFLRREYENLLTVDFICHGVPSPGVFRWYIQEKTNNFVAQNCNEKSYSFSPILSIPKETVKWPESICIKNISFRDKREGWKKYSFTIDLVETTVQGSQNTISLSSNVVNNTFLKGFVHDLYLRPSCHKCPSRNYKSGSDLTIADFWGQEYMFPEFDNDTGVSAVIIKTDKGEKWVCSLKFPIMEKKTIDQVLADNPSLLQSKRQSYNSKKFWRIPDTFSFSERVNTAINLSFSEKIYLKLKSYL